MTMGVTGSYAINGTEITIQPTSGQWMPRDPLGIDGNGHFVYPPYREFEMTWGLLAPSDVNQLQNFFASIGNTGTAVVDLPKFAAVTYTFYSYSGCVLQEPSIGVYFSENQTEITLLVSKIRT
jgi:hypothetical protein